MDLSIYEPWFNGARRRNNPAAQQADPASHSDWTPAVDIREAETGFVIHADIPGVDPKAIEITMDEGVLTIQGKRKLLHSEDRRELKRSERRRGTFLRRFSLPDTADANNITAASKHGVLEINIPKLAKSQPRRVEVQH